MIRMARLLGVIWMVLPLPAAGQYWADYRPEGVGYSIELPGEWKIVTQPVTSGRFTINLHTATVTFKGRAYYSIYSSIPEDRQHWSVTEILDDARNGAVANGKGQLRSEERVLISNLPARYIIIDLPGNFVAAMRFFVLESSLVQGTVVGPPGIESEPDTKRVLGSLKVVKR